MKDRTKHKMKMQKKKAMRSIQLPRLEREDLIIWMNEHGYHVGKYFPH